MLYLYGDSGTTYLYIHLNNDLTTGNDNRGTCVAGTAYATGLKSGDRVDAGQPVGFVGDSGDANGITSHLHFEVHPKGRRRGRPVPVPAEGEHLLFAARPARTFTLALTGTVVERTRLSRAPASTSLRPGSRLIATRAMTLTIGGTRGHRRRRACVVNARSSRRARSAR